MAEEPEVQGAPGESAAPTAGEVNLDELVAELGKAPAEAKPEPAAVDEEFVKKLESLDPGALPESFRRKLEAPFLSNMTKKTTEFDQERQRLLGLVERLSTRPQTGQQEPGIDEKELLRQKIAEGDVNAIEQLLDQRMEAKYGADIKNIKMDNAYRTALQMFPQAAQMEPQIAEALKTNPGVAYVIANVSPRDPQLGGMLLAGVAKNLAYDKAVAEHEALKASIPKLVKHGIEEYQRRIGKLPASTSRAGTTPSGEPAETPKSLRDAMEAAWAEAGGS